MKTNSELLNYKGNLLSGIDRQRRYILQRHSMRMPCPNCATPHNVFEAQSISVDDYDINGTTEGPFHCTKCKREMNYVLPMMGDWHWALVPIEVN